MTPSPSDHCDVILRYECSECGSQKSINNSMHGPFCGHHPAAKVITVRYERVAPDQIQHSTEDNDG